MQQQQQPGSESPALTSGRQGLAGPRSFDLAGRKPNKTLDIGVNGVSLSLDPLGRILQLSSFHPEHGIIVAAPYEQFDGSKFFDPLSVRAYRKRMLEYIQTGTPGFGLRIEGREATVSIEHVASNLARIQYRLEDGVSVSMTLEVSETGMVTQRAQISNDGEIPATVQYIFDLGISIHRASYGQLTEGGPIPLPESENSLELIGDNEYFTITNRFLNGHLEGCFEVDGKIAALKCVQSQTRYNEPVRTTCGDIVTMAAKSTMTIAAHFYLLPTTAYRGKFEVGTDGVASTLAAKAVWHHPDEVETFIIRRNLDYIVGNCAIPVSEDEVAIITDHVALPLGWNRDNYWQVRLLLKATKNMQRIAAQPPPSIAPQALRKIVRGHLRWVFLRAVRPHGFWHRSYVVTGQPKDGPVFQLDQQCYPFLELCDYFEQYPEDHAFVKELLEQGTTSEVVDLMLSKRHEASGLLPTDETPGDDAVEYPYHFSSHVLLWYTISRLAKVVEVLGADSFYDSTVLVKFAADLRAAALKHFITTRDGKPMIAYLTDGQDQYTFYHDANDIPTLFAPSWGFISASAADVQQQAWRNTMDWAVTPANEKGYCEAKDTAGEFGGLGSVHSPGAWTLGYFQEFVYAQMCGNTAAEKDAWRRIQGAMQWDGSFSEAVDVTTAQCTSKAWFSWPGSMIASALIDMRANAIVHVDGF